MRVRTLFAALLLLAFAHGQNPPAAAPKKDYLERRATILRQMAEIPAKLAALELDLQLLEESRAADPAPPPPGSWREDQPAGEPGSTVKKGSPRCLQVTRDGKRCTRTAEAGAKYCWQHRNH